MKDTHGYLYIKDQIAKNEVFKNLFSSVTIAEPEEMELVLKSPTSSCSSLVSLRSVIRDTMAEDAVYEWEAIEKFLIERDAET